MAVAVPDGTVPAVSGSGTKDYVPLWTSSTALGKSTLYQTGGKVGVGTTTPAAALDVSGSVNASSTFNIAGTTVLAVPGKGSMNTAVGNFTLSYLNGGVDDTAVGYQAMELNTTGEYNTAVGQIALNGNTGGNYNTAVGEGAIGYNSGDYNTAVGAEALSVISTGVGNTALGTLAGSALQFNASNNIEIGNNGQSNDNGVIRIGTVGTQTSFYAAGIYGVSSGSSSAIPVLVDSSGQLVTVSSSRRYKEDIQDMGNASSDLMRLRPVTFRYKKPLADGSQPVQYGLVAEEVAEVYPDLVSYSADGQVETVKYQLLDPMLLNEVQRQQAAIRDLQEQLNQIKRALAATPGSPVNAQP
jgi:hypothetical protein